MEERRTTLGFLAKCRMISIKQILLEWEHINRPSHSPISYFEQVFISEKENLKEYLLGKIHCVTYGCWENRGSKCWNLWKLRKIPFHSCGGQQFCCSTREKISLQIYLTNHNQLTVKLHFPFALPSFPILLIHVNKSIKWENLYYIFILYFSTGLQL